MTLDPKGTLRAAFQPQVGADVFRQLDLGAQRCDLGDEALYLAEEIVRADPWIGDQAQALGVLVLALMIAQRQGSTRLPLDPKGPLKTLVGDIVRIAGLPDGEARKILAAIGRLTGAPGFDSVVGAGDARVPLIVEAGCLYSERSRWLERRVAARLAVRIASQPQRDVTAVIAELAARPGERALSHEQLRAVELALGGQLAVVTGGPGTGKTVVAAAIVRGLARLEIAPIALAAATGKAANRLTEVIGEQLRAIADPAELDRALVANLPVGQTLHRLLGRGHTHYVHHAQSPLPFGAVIIDEASMIDLELMDAVLDALPVTAPLILLGDAHQLPAIDAGQILADLATTQARVATLEHSYRMDSADPRGRAVLEAARSIRSGAIPKLGPSRTPGQLTWSGVEWVDARSDEQTRQVVAALWHHFDGPRAHDRARTVFRFTGGVIDPTQEAELLELFELVGRARILTVTRGQATGADALNAHLHQLALDRTTTTGRPELVPGEPVMVTQNDYHRGLFNGDQGLVVRADEGRGHHRYRAVFRTGGVLAPFAIEPLRDRLELSWAMTVHKSQGSEYDAVALVLPHEDLPLVTRELLYTGLTRARTGVVIAGGKDLLTTGVKRSALRYSGLADRISGSLSP